MSSTWTAIHAAVLDLIETVPGLTRSPIPLIQGSIDADGVGPTGGSFEVLPATLAFGGSVAGHADSAAAFVLTFAWARTPDPSTRIAEAMERGDAIRSKLLDEAQATIPDVRFDPGDIAFAYDGADLIFVAIPFTLTSYRTT